MEKSVNFVSDVGRSVRHNPIPLALMGAGLAWMVVGSISRSHYASSDFDTDYTKTRFSDTAGRTADRVKETASSFGESISEGARDFRSQVRSRGSRLRHRAAETSHRLSKSFDHLLHEQPLVVGALAIAIGAAIGALIPSTQIEDEYFGHGRDDLIDGGQELAEDVVHDVGEVATAAYEAAKEETEKKIPT